VTDSQASASFLKKRSKKLLLNMGCGNASEKSVMAAEAAIYAFFTRSSMQWEF
jgi:hypothetical protein